MINNEDLFNFCILKKGPGESDAAFLTRVQESLACSDCIDSGCEHRTAPYCRNIFSLLDAMVVRATIVP